MEELNTKRATTIKIKNKLSEAIFVTLDIRIYFKHNTVQHYHWYKMGRNINQILFDVALRTDSEDNLQRILFQINKTARQPNMKVWTEKTKIDRAKSPYYSTEQRREVK